MTRDRHRSHVRLWDTLCLIRFIFVNSDQVTFFCDYGDVLDDDVDCDDNVHVQEGSNDSSVEEEEVNTGVPK